MFVALTQTSSVMPPLNSCGLLVIVLKGSHSNKGAFIWRSCKEDESRTNFCLDPYIMYCILLLICLLMDTFIASLPVVASDIWKMLGVTLNSSFIYPPYLLTQLTLLYQIHLFFSSPFGHSSGNTHILSSCFCWQKEAEIPWA